MPYVNDSQKNLGEKTESLESMGNNGKNVSIAVGVSTGEHWNGGNSNRRDSQNHLYLNLTELGLYLCSVSSGD